MSKQKVIVYQMGKVASSSIASSLKMRGDMDVFHTHSLNADRIRALNEFKVSKGWSGMVNDSNKTSALYKTIKNENKKISVITMVREPIGRNISAFFQNLHIIFRNGEIGGLCQSQLAESFISRYPHRIPIEWFDKELKECLGVDVYKVSFPKKKGAIIINDGRYDVLIMRHDIPDFVKQDYIGRLLHITDVKITPKNIGKEKSYALIYKDFIEQVTMSDAYLSEMLDSKYAKHFFEKRELELLKIRWGRS